MLLYNSQVSGNCYKVRLLLAQLGIEYERHEVDVIERSTRAEVLGGVNPALSVPTVVLDDGSPLAESNAILWYFGEGTPYMPEARLARARVLQWLSFEQFSHQPYIALVRYWLSIAHTDVAKEKLDARRAPGYFALGAMERHLQRNSFFVDDRYTIADIALYAYTHVAEEGGFDLSMFPAIGAWLDRVAEQPDHVPMIA